MTTTLARQLTPDRHYEATVSSLVTPGCHWLDAGGGRDLFPHNRRLAGQVAPRAGRLVAVDPDPTVRQHPHAVEKHQSLLEDFRDPAGFDLVTLRMVVEHVADPERFVRSLALLTRPGGRVVVYTVNRWSPLALAAALTPTWVHDRVKRKLWGTLPEDTFPVCYRMNTRGELRRLFAGAGFREAHFAYLDDCRTFHRFPLLRCAEHCTRLALNAVGWHYPETCLLGVYRRVR